MDDLGKQRLCDYKADRQAREVYRYFQPANPAALKPAWPPFGDDWDSVTDLPATTPSVAPDFSISEQTATGASVLSSPNTTLTSFAQLAALHLQAERAFITILNRDSQFIIAEATKTIHIGNSKLSVGEEGRFFAGTSTLANPWNICRETVAIPSDKQDGKYPMLVINDLAQEDRFKHLPFVKGEPHSRFYAGTPLTAESDINLGCLFVLDPLPREGLSNTEKDALGTVAAMVMDYFHISRQAVEGRRALRLSQGLRLFVDGNSSFANKAHVSRSNTATSSSSSRGSSYPRMNRSTGSESNPSEPRLTRSEIGDTRCRDDEARSLSPPYNAKLETDMPPNATTSFPSLQRGDSSSSVSSSSNDWLFQRAANLLRQGLDLDGAGGVIFLKNSNELPDNFADSHSNPTDSSNPAPVLSISTRDDPLSFQTGTTPSCPSVNIDKAFLNQLTCRYPKGRLWSFHSDGTLSTSDEDESIGAARELKNSFKVSETSKLNTYFPNACQVMFVPLWNAIDSQWFSGCFCWTPQPTKVFSRAVDLSSVFGFASAIMTEYSRVESVIADRQKGDFISSISHELRSPLHGVLAATEFLSDTRVDEYQESLVETITGCGRTLLDTMNQVLDFSKIMSLQRRKRRYRCGKDPWKPKITHESPARMDPLVSTDVAILTEDVVDSVCLGHSHMKRLTTSTIRPAIDSPISYSNVEKEDNELGFLPEVEVVVDISNNDWLYKVQPGSLRRLIMNLLGNALKYTKKGVVSVCIEVAQQTEGCSRRRGLENMVTLTVSDTGRGISSEYLRTRLYTPFSQEDTLSTGTGLGLSIVRGIVDTLNGSINIQSRVGEGTIVKVSFPLERPVGEENPPSTPHVDSPEQKTITASSRLRLMDLTGKRAAIWGLGSSCLPEHHFWSSIARYVTDWYGMEVVSWSANEHIDVLCVDESNLSAESSQHLPTGLPSLLVVCNHRSSSGDPSKKWSHLAESVGILRRPCGPQRLARGILSCLNPEPASATSLRLGHESVVPVPCRLPRPLTEESTLLSYGQLNHPTDESSNHLSGARSSVIDLVERDDAVPWLESPSRATSENTASNTHAPSSTPSSSGSPAPDDVSSESQSGPRVLLVDDNDINLRLLVNFMKKRKVAILDTAENGRAAVRCVERMLQGYDLIFMDVSMPIMDGFEATLAIRKIEKERDGSVPAKIIAFTGLSSLRAESRSMDSGMDLFLTKPVSFKQVSRLVNEWEIESSK